MAMIVLHGPSQLVVTMILTRLAMMLSLLRLLKGRPMRQAYLQQAYLQQV